MKKLRLDIFWTLALIMLNGYFLFVILDLDSRLGIGAGESWMIALLSGVLLSVFLIRKYGSVQVVVIKILKEFFNRYKKS